MDRHGAVESIGMNNFWGFSPSIHWDELDIDGGGIPKGRNILLNNVNDFRHILRSLGEETNYI